MREQLPAAVKVYMAEYNLTKEEAFHYWVLFVEKGYSHCHLMQIVKGKKGA